MNKSALCFLALMISGLSVSIPVSFAGESEKTTLRLVGEPKGEFVTSMGAVYVRTVEVKVRNAGDRDALKVKTSVTIPGGKSFELDGPETIAPGKTASYKKDIEEYVLTTQKLKASFSCDNCR